MIFNVYRNRYGGLALTEKDSDWGKDFEMHADYKLLGTIDLPIIPEKKETEKSLKAISQPENGLATSSVVFHGTIPDDAYDIEVHYKIKE
jgi:hypothetical protein